MTASRLHSALPDPFDQPEFYDGVPTKRLLAWAVDVILIMVLALVIVLITALTALFVFPVLLLTVGFVYRVATLSRYSATLGMQLMSIELRTAQDTPLDAPTAFFHTLGYSVSVGSGVLQLVSVAMMLATDRGQGLTDMVLGTVALNRRLTL